MPVVPSGIWHAPETQIPLAQSGPVTQLVFGRVAVVSQSPPVHLPLWQSLAWVHGEPPSEGPPGVEPTEVEPPGFEPPEPPDVELPSLEPPEPPGVEP
jgi:hypothetical protein